jgi:hypothetical protein
MMMAPVMLKIEFAMTTWDRAKGSPMRPTNAIAMRPSPSCGGGTRGRGRGWVG